MTHKKAKVWDEFCGTAALGTLEQIVGHALWGLAAIAALAGLFILLFRIPARTAVLFDGAKAERRNIRGAIILNGVHTVDGGYATLFGIKVEDLLLFHTREGEEVRVVVRRRYRSEPAALIWYSARNPRRATTRNPLACFALAFACAVTATWLRW